MIVRNSVIMFDVSVLKNPKVYKNAMYSVYSPSGKPTFAFAGINYNTIYLKFTTVTLFAEKNHITTRTQIL